MTKMPEEYPLPPPNIEITGLTLEKLARRGLLDGWCGEGESLRLDLGEDSLRLLTLLDRAGVFDLVR